MPTIDTFYILDVDETIFSSDPLFHWIWRAKELMKTTVHHAAQSSCCCPCPTLFSGGTRNTPKRIDTLKKEIEHAVINPIHNSSSKYTTTEKRQRKELVHILFSAIDKIQNAPKHNKKSISQDDFDLELFLSSLLDHSAIYELSYLLHPISVDTEEFILQNENQRCYFFKNKVIDHQTYQDIVIDSITVPTKILFSSNLVCIVNKQRIGCLLDHIKKNDGAQLIISTAGEWQQQFIKIFLQSVHGFTAEFDHFNAHDFKRSISYNHHKFNKIDTLLRHKVLDITGYANTRIVVIDNCNVQRKSVFKYLYGMEFINPNENLPFVKFGLVERSNRSTAINSYWLSSKRAKEVNNLTQPLLKEGQHQIAQKTYDSLDF